MPADPVPGPIVAGARLGHATTAEGTTGVTAVVFDRATPTVVDVRGGASATYDLASLGLSATFGRRWAIFFAGGSVFGLDAAAGIRERIREEGGGHAVFEQPRRIAPVSGAALFDLPPGDGPVPEYRPLGYAAARAARPGPVATGRVGAGAGATVGKYRGRDRAMHGGIGWATGRLGGGRVGVLVALNASGAIRDPATGRWVAGARDLRGRIVAPGPARTDAGSEPNTTLALLATDLAVDRPTLYRAVAIAHAALGAAIVPFHASVDGDLMFGAATGTAPAPLERRPGATADALGLAAAECAVRAAVDGVRAANAGRRRRS